MRLPGTGDLDKIHHDSDMPLLQHIEGLGPAVTLPPLAGTVFTGYLYRRLLEHVHHSHQQYVQWQQQQQLTTPSYPFWVTHYYLDRLVVDCRTRTSREQPSAKDRVLSLTMQSNLAAVEMLLHGTALSRAEAEPHLPQVLRTEAASRCAAAAMRVHDVVVRAKQLMPGEMDGHRQSGEFLNWPITSAISILRMQHQQQGKGQGQHQGKTSADGVVGPSAVAAGGDPEPVRTLVGALKELVPNDLIPDGVLEQPGSDGLAGRERSDGEDEGGAKDRRHGTRFRRSCSF